MACCQIKSIYRAVFQLLLSVGRNSIFTNSNLIVFEYHCQILGFISWSFIVFCMSFSEFSSWFFITRVACILTGFWIVNFMIAFEVFFCPMDEFYLLWKINRELFVSLVVSCLQCLLGSSRTLSSIYSWDWL